ncbi:MAG: hypothetical protein JXR18_03325 [Neptuniibacter sp.]
MNQGQEGRGIYASEGMAMEGSKSSSEWRDASLASSEKSQKQNLKPQPFGYGVLNFWCGHD